MTRRVQKSVLIQAYKDNNLELLNPDDYKNNKLKLKYKCLSCGYLGENAYNNLQQGRGRCSRCVGISSPSQEQLIKEFCKVNLKLIKPIKYKNVKSKLKYVCKTCGHQGEREYTYVKRGRGCHSCYKKFAKNLPPLRSVIINTFLKQSLELLNIDEYKNCMIKNLKYRCLKCGYEGEKRYNDVQQNYGCPNCYYKNENECREILKHLCNKSFDKAKPKWLLNTKGNRMELDGYNKELNIAFEYQGEQHYYDVSNWNKKYTLKERKEADKLKLSLCKQKGVNLIVIPYTTKNKKKFIIKKLKELNLL